MALEWLNVCSSVFQCIPFKSALPSLHDPKDAIGVTKETPMALEKQFKLEAAEKPKAIQPFARRR